MKSYDQVTNFISAEIDKLSLDEQIRFLQRLIYQFVKELPSDWLDGELAQEKPHYQAIYNQIVNQTWQKSTIEDALTELDNIMFGMGANYPHNTDDRILLALELLDYWLVLKGFEQKSTKHNTIVISAIMGYLSYFEELVEHQTNTTPDFDTWLDYPQTKHGFEMLELALNQVK